MNLFLNKNNNKKAFTLIELLVVITLVSIIILGLSNLDFKGQREKEDLEKKVNKVVSIFEEIQINSLLGKAKKNFEVPEKRKITFSTGANNEFILKKFYLSGSTWNNIEKTVLKKPGFLVNFYCSELNNSTSTSTGSFGGTGEIIFEGKKLYLSGSTECLDKKMQKLEIDFKLKNFKKKIIINTLSGNIGKNNK